jgi:hypothetical protein
VRVSAGVCGCGLVWAGASVDTDPHVVVGTAGGEEGAGGGPGGADHVAGAGARALEVVHGRAVRGPVGARPEGHRPVRRRRGQPPRGRAWRPVHRRYRARVRRQHPARGARRQAPAYHGGLYGAFIITT